VRYSFCNEGFGKRPWGAVCETLAEAGYDGVEIAPYVLREDVRDIAPGDRAEIRGQAEGLGLEIVGLHWLLVKPEGLHVSHPDETVRARTREYLCHLADFCADLGGKIMVFGSPKQRGGSAGASPPDAWKWAAETFRGVLPVLEARGVTLCIEPLAPAETDFINTAAEGRCLVEEIRHPNFRMILDCKAMTTEGKPLPDVIRAHRDILAHVHVNDPELRAPGMGDMDFGPILAALKEIGYQGYVSVEPFVYEPDVDTVARQSLAYLRDYLPS
jgi:sugar phosphate isomerase/epimerase